MADVATVLFLHAVAVFRTGKTIGRTTIAPCVVEEDAVEGVVRPFATHRGAGCVVELGVVTIARTTRRRTGVESATEEVGGTAVGRAVPPAGGVIVGGGQIRILFRAGQELEGRIKRSARMIPVAKPPGKSEFFLGRTRTRK